jgi:hypothetical protein
MTRVTLRLLGALGSSRLGTHTAEIAPQTPRTDRGRPKASAWKPLRMASAASHATITTTWRCSFPCTTHSTRTAKLG